MKVFLNEKGMTFIELLFATFLLAFVLIALLSLMMGAVTTASIAKNQTQVTALANKLIEEVRGMTYAEIGIEGATDPNVPTGTLPPGHMASGSYEYWYEVVWVDDVADNTPQTETGSDDDKHDYKKVTVNVSSSSSPSSTIQVTTIIGKKAASTSAPTVSFLSPTPAALTAVSGTGVQVKGTATDSDGQVVYLRFYFEGHTPEGANFTENSSSATESFTWDTLETYTDLYGVTHRYYEDGAREVKVQAWDNAGATSYWEIYLVVDNDAPTFPTSEPLLASPSNYDKVTLTWKAANDGTDRIENYYVYRSTNGTTWTQSSVGASNLSYNPTTGSYSYDYTGLSPWTNYYFRIEARSPLNVQNSSEGFVAAGNTDSDNMTLIKLEGTTGKTSGKRYCQLTWTPATKTGVTFDVYRDGVCIMQNATSPYTDNNNGSGLSGNTTYTYYVLGVGGGNTSNTITLTTPN